MKLLRVKATSILLLFLCTLLPGCFYKKPVRHIASEASLIVPNQTTERELVTFMGLPNEKKALSKTEEEWLYFQTNKSLLRQSPIWGEKMGYQDYDVAIIHLKDNTVVSCQYRSFSEDEFKQLGIASRDKN